MAIYSRWGTEHKLVANCGEQRVKGFEIPLTLLKTVRVEDGKPAFQFAAFLRADNAAAEIDDAVKELPTLTLTKHNLKIAIQEAL